MAFLGNNSFLVANVFISLFYDCHLVICYLKKKYCSFTFDEMFDLLQALQTSNEDEINEFVSTFRTQLEIFVNRMKSNQSRGGGL